MGEGEAVAFGIEPSAFLAEVTSFFSKVFWEKSVGIAELYFTPVHLAWAVPAPVI